MAREITHIVLRCCPGVSRATAIAYIVLGVSRMPLTNHSREDIPHLVLLASWRSIDWPYIGELLNVNYPSLYYL